MDRIALHLFCTMVEDFRSLLGDNAFAEQAVKAIQQGPGSFRDYVFPTLGEVPPMRYKAWWQLANFLKRYRFTTDAYDDAELERKTIKKFLEFQVERSHPEDVTPRSFAVLQEARRICKQILSLPYDTGPFRKFGRRATFGCPLRLAYFDSKFAGKECFTSSPSLRKEILQFLKCDMLGKQIARARRRLKLPLFTETDALTLTLVPKSWKTLRAITPLTEFGLYWSYGIGGYVEECLRLYGLDIKRLQDRHKALSRKYSCSRSHVTADLSSASDSLTSSLLNRVLPRYVYTDLRKTFHRQLLIDGKKYYTCSVLPMGNASTFPVETLVFYCLIKAIGNLLKVKGTFSVYGDDLIYPTRIHPYVTRIFRELGIKINGDKTFVDSYFRESCGGDYYHGIDVRPALFPEAGCSFVHKKERLQVLYKIWNALHDRWNRIELPHTFQFLEWTIMRESHGTVFFVPRSFPSTAGYRVSRPPKTTWLLQHDVKLRFNNGSQWYIFSALINRSPRKRVVAYEQFYLFTSLRPSEDTTAKRRALKYVAQRFLKTLGNREVKPTSFSRVYSEPLHESGLCRVSKSQVSTWT